MPRSGTRSPLNSVPSALPPPPGLRGGLLVSGTGRLNISVSLQAQTRCCRATLDLSSPAPDPVGTQTGDRMDQRAGTTLESAVAVLMRRCRCGLKAPFGPQAAALDDRGGVQSGRSRVDAGPVRVGSVGRHMVGPRSHSYAKSCERQASRRSRRPWRGPRNPCPLLTSQSTRSSWCWRGDLKILDCCRCAA